MQDADFSSMAEGRVQIINHFTFLGCKMGSFGDSVIVEAVVFFNDQHCVCSLCWPMGNECKI